MPDIPTNTRMGNNNLSRELFSQFLQLNDLERVDQRNMFYGKDGQKIAFAYTIKDKPYCRQFYHDATAMVILTPKRVYEFNADELVLDAINRFGATGVAAKTARPKR